MKLLGKIGVLFVSIVVFAWLLVELEHWRRFGHFAPLGLHADVLVRKADYGIPGISNAYVARLTNFGIVPVRMTVCDFQSDDSSHGTLVGSRLEKWDSAGKVWRSVYRAGDASSCHPYPLGMVETHVVSRELWPGHSVSAGEGAYAAFDGLAIGDKVRFVILPGSGRAISTAAFSIDEHPTRVNQPRQSRLP
jgi:hypothetical protein